MVVWVVPFLRVLLGCLSGIEAILQHYQGFIFVASLMSSGFLS
tara:strand:+ start:507 stop:635 length:129 start_codon:yes stop_codon:yes gene_type:complete